MGKSANLYIKKNSERIEEICSDVISEAEISDLKVLSTMLLFSDAEGKISVSIEKIATILDMTVDSVSASVKFWKGAGVVSSTLQKKAASARSSAHREGVLESNPEVSYSTGELVSILERKETTAAFIDEAQRIFGKTFNAYDSNIAAGIIDRLGFEPEAALAILAYCAERGKKTMRYAEKMAISFYDEEITTSNAVYEKIKAIEKNAILTEQIKKLYGVGDRSLSSNEKKLFERWGLEYGFDIEIIRLAYDITIDNAHSADPKYTNGVLSKWYEAGVKTAEDVEKYEAQRKSDYSAPKPRAKKTQTQGNVDRDKSYDIDEFFAASLARGFEEIK